MEVGIRDDRTVEDGVLEVADRLVTEGRVVPGLTVDDDGRARSWWWPLPAARHRSLIAALVLGPTEADQRVAADCLAEAVDTMVRERLVAGGEGIGARRAGRPTVAEAWVRSLAAADPWLPASLDMARVRALAVEVAAWVRSGAVVAGLARLCVRVHEPASARAPWQVELLAQDLDEPSLVVPVGEVLAGDSPFGAGAGEVILAALGRMARLAPELAGALEEAVPGRVDVDERSVLLILRERLGALEDAGISVLLPSWWTRRPRLGLRAKVTGGANGTGGFSLGDVFEFTFEAALDDRRLTKSDIAALARAAAAKQALVRVRGQWVEVDAADVEALLAELATPRHATGEELLRAGLGLGQLDSAVEVVDVDVTKAGWLGDLLDGAVHARVAPIATPEGFEGRLRPYQERGVGWLAFLGRLGLGACLADDMGLGKTAQLVATMLGDPADGPTLVVCPVSVLGNWQRELARFAPSLRVHVHHGGTRHDAVDRLDDHDVVLTTYSLLARDLVQLEPVQWGRIAFDEAQQIKNPGAAQSRAARRLRAPRRVALTGTPVENRITELWSIMEVLNPGLLGTQRSFRERFALPIERDCDDGAAERLRRVTGPFILRRLKTDKSIVADLPDKIETVDRCPLTREQATLYRAVVDDLLDAAENEEGIARRGAVLAGLLRLKQVCNHPAHFLADGSPLAGRSGKLARVEELLEEILAEGDKALCFTQFTAWGEIVGPYLERRFGTEALWLHGGVRRKARDAIVERFQSSDGPQLFLVSLKAGGTGLNLTAASHVVHLDRWWNPAVEDQATDRAHRIGQRRSVQVHKLVSTGTVEERIDELIRAKRELARRVVGSGEEWLSELSTSDLRDLVALRDGEVG